MLNAILGTDAPADVDSRRGLFAAILLGVIGPEVFIVQPGFVQGLVEHLGFDEQSAGYTASAEMFGIAATTVALTFAADRTNWRVVLALSLLVMFAANAACTTVADRDAFVALRFVAGLGAGGIVSLSFAAIGLTRHPDRNFGYLIMWVLTYGALGLLAMPSAFDLFGMAGVLWFFALFPLAALPVIRFMPVTGENVAQVEKDAVDLPPGLKLLALLAMLAYFLAQGVVWAYLFLIGIAGGLGEQQVANGLMLSQFAGIAGALGAALLAHRAPRAAALSIGILGGAAMLFFLVGRFDFALFALAVSVYNLAWNFTHPFLLGSMASFDRRGRVVVHAVAMQMVGLAVGPSLAASVISDGDYVNVNALGTALFVVSLALILPPVLGQARRFRSARLARTA
jgi:predicted MFS family arabinose efflux permease